MPFADELLGAEQVAALARILTTVAPERRWDAVADHAVALGDLALGERARLVGTTVAAAAGSLAALAPIVESALGSDEFRGWMIWPMTEAVAELATADGSPEAIDIGLDLMAALTPRLTAEFSIRHLLIADPERAMAAVTRWADDPDEHVRRLASEGTRPHLPWAKAIPAISADPDRTVPVLDRLYRDPSESVRRSVANHLNDISRRHPEVVVATASRWLDDPDDTTAPLVRHALRTLVKKGDPGALRVLGFGTPDDLTVTGPVLDTTEIALGDSLGFEATVTNTADDAVTVVVDFVLHLRKANGATAPKVFKLSTASLAPGETRTFRKAFPIRPITTRRYYPGEQRLEIQVNGRRHGGAPFLLTTDS